MKIKWSKDSAENDRAVCEALGIPPRFVQQSCSMMNGKVLQELKSYPRVTTDAIEALKIPDYMDHGFNLGLNSGDRKGRVWVASFGQIAHWGSDMCHSICIAALRTKGIEVEL